MARNLFFDRGRQPGLKSLVSETCLKSKSFKILFVSLNRSFSWFNPLVNYRWEIGRFTCIARFANLLQNSSVMEVCSQKVHKRAKI